MAELTDVQRACLTLLQAAVHMIILLLLILFFSNPNRYLFKIPYFRPCTLPHIKSNQIMFYISALLTIYRQSSPECPALCYIYHWIGGIGKVFEKERIVQLYLLFKPAVLFFKPETVERVLSSSEVIDKSTEYDLLLPWLGRGLLTSSGAKWRSRRKLLTPTFHFSILEDFIPVFHEQSSVLVSKIEAHTQKPWIDIVPLITSCTLDIICQTAMGVNVDAQGSENNDYVKAIVEIGDAFMYRVLRPWLYPDIIFRWTTRGRKLKTNLRHVKGLTRKVIKEKKRDMIKQGKLSPVAETAPDGSPMQRKKRKAFLEFLLETHLKDPSFTEENIREEVDTFMFEGHDTTAMAISWTLYCLGLHPKVQKEAQNELDDVFQDDPDREITREDLTRMKYIECVVKETLRLFPSVPIIARECRVPFKVLDYTVPQGSVCIIFPPLLHLDEEAFPEPEKFIPERFLPENVKGRHPYAYIPFSAGPRNCIGQKFALMEEKTVIANILRRFHITSLDQRDKIMLMPNLVIRNANPLRLRFQLR